MENQSFHEIEVQITGVNVLLIILQFMAGIFTGSLVMTADALRVAAGTFCGSRWDVHRMGSKQDQLKSICLSLLFKLSGMMFVIISVIKMITIDYRHEIQHGVLAVLAAALAVFVKNILYHRLRQEAEKAESSSLMADAWRQRADGVILGFSLVAILLAWLGFPILDLIVGIAVCLFVIFE